jgi:hypothetical protein
MVLIVILMVLAAILIIAVMVLAVVTALATFTGRNGFRDVDDSAPDRDARVNAVVSEAAIDRSGPNR